MSRKQKVLKYRLLQSKYALWKNVVHVFTTSQLFVSIYVAAAPPTNGVVSVGAATITQTANQTTIQQNSAKTAINWTSFSIDPTYTVRYIQPDASSIALNRVTGNLPTSIQGQLLANGQVWILNPNGVYIGKTGTINSSSFLASTNSISDTNFMSGNYTLTSGGITGTYVTNEGKIVVSDGGYAVLTGQAVRNDGYIQANLGQAVLAGAKTTTLNLLGNQLMSFAITSPVDVQPLDGRAIVDNSGKIQGNGGTVLLSARAASNVIGQVVNTSGMIQATSAKLVNGVVVLDGGDSGEVSASGTIDVSGKNLGETGGNVTILGQQITLASNTSIDASGSIGGGTVLIGGGWQGGAITNAFGKPENYTPATNATIASGVVINSSAIDQGDGGTIVVWSDVQNPQSTTKVDGTLLAKGGVLTGNGGNVETSGHLIHINNATVNTQSVSGKIGNWLIDPGEFRIAASNGDLTGAALSATLSNSSVTISSNNGTSGSSGNILVNDNISWTSNSNILVLNATNNVVLNADISYSGSNSNLTMNASNLIVLNSNISLSSPSALLHLNANTTGNGVINSSGNIHVSQASSISIGSLTGTGSITLGSGKLNLNNASGNYSGVISGGGGFTLNNGTLTLGGNNTYSGGTIINNGTLQISSDQNLGNGIGNLTLNATNAPTLQVNGNFSTARNLILANTGNATIDVTNGNTLIANGTISGNGTLVKTDTGTLRINSANTYTGGTTILAGTLATPGGLGGNSLSSGNVNLGGGTFEVMYPPGNGSYYLFRSDAFNLITGTNSTIVVDSGINLGGLGNISGNGSLTINAQGGFQNSGNLNAAGSLTVLGNGTVSLSGINSYTGQTYINGGHLELIGNGSISNSSSVANNGTFSITGTTNGTTITSLSGNGNTDLGSKLLTLSNASGNYSGNISGTGGLTLNNGIETLSGNNSYSGGTIINNGTLQVSSDQNLGNSSGSVTLNATNAPILRVNGNFSTTRGLILSNIGHATIDVTNGNTLTANGTISGNGTLVKSDTGTLIINSANTYSGGTTILAGTLATAGAIGGPSLGTGIKSLAGGTLEIQNAGVSGSYSISQGNSIVVAGTNSTFLVDSGVTYNTSGNFTGGGNLTINALGTFQSSGNFNTTGSITVLGSGLVKLLGTNSYTGSTTINGGTLNLIGNGSIASSSLVNITNNGTFDVSGLATGTSIVSLAGNGSVALGTNNLNLTNANDIFSGNISGKNGGSLSILGGSQTLTGNNNFSAGLNVSNATLVIGSQNAVGTGNINLANGILETQSVSNLSFNNNISLTGSSQFHVQGNTTDTLNGVITGNGSFGVMNTNGSLFGVLNLAGQNTYTGTTTIYPNIKLSLIGNGSIAVSDSVFNAGAFDISATSNGATIRNIENNAVNLGSKTLTITNAGINGSGNLSVVTGEFLGDSLSQINLVGGTLAVSGNSSGSFLGSTVIGNNSTLAIRDNGSLAGSNILNISGVLDLQTNNVVNLSNLKLTPTGLITNSNGSASLLVSGMSNLSGTVSTSGSQTYQGLVLLGGNTTLNTLSSDINFGSTIDGKTATSQNLTINTGSGITYLNGAVGSTTKLSSITISGSSSILNSVNTTGMQTYGGNVTLTGPSASLNSDAGSINLVGNSFTPYEGSTYGVVGNLAALQNIGANNLTLSGNWIVGTDIDASATASMNQGVGFIPIGTQLTPFIGNVVNTFNHTINNLSINRPTTDYVGLFGYVSNASISGIRIANSNITGQSYVGGLVGYTLNTNILGNNVSGTVNGSYYVGGLIGQQTDSYVDASKTSGIVTGLADVGGLVGTLFSKLNTVNGNSINNSSSSATVLASGTGNLNEYQPYLIATNAGGLVGLNYAGGTINQSYATGNVSGTDPNSKFVGGLVGEMFQPSELAINSSYATGNVSGGTNVGGLLGNANHGLINLSNASGNVTATGNYVGGLVGSIEYSASINTSYATGNVNGSLSDSSFVGGLVGSMGPGESISNSYATGNVAGFQNIGGLAGQGGVITSSNASGNVSGGSSIGGLVGSLSNPNSSILNSSAAGSVVSTDTFVGGLVGFLSSGAQISSSFATGNVSGVNLVGGLVGINAQSNILSSYATGVVNSSGTFGYLYGQNSGTVSEDSYGTNGARYISNQTIYILGNGTLVDGNQTLLSPSVSGFFLSSSTLIDSINSPITLPSNIILGNTNTFQVNTGAQLSLSGVLSGTGNLTKAGTGWLSLQNTNTYTGVTNISNGTLALVANGSISSSNQLINNGTFDISSAKSSFITSLTGSGNVALGTQSLTITNANDTFSGVISDSGQAGPGSLIISGGNQTLSGVNTYVGPTQINSGTTLALSGNGSIANSSLVNATGTFDIGGTSGSSIQSLSGSGTVALGSQNLNITNANNTFSGVIADGGIINDATGGSLTLFSGTQTLSASNSSYTGATLIHIGATLALNGNGSIANSSMVNATGTLDIGLTYGTSIKSLSGNGTVALGSQNLNITNANDTFSGVIADGGLSPAIGGVGGSLTIGQETLVIGPGQVTSNQTLTGPNTYTGNTTITEGA